MEWQKCRVINGHCSGRVVDLPSFQAMIETSYRPLLSTETYRFIGDDSPWQQKGGAASMTATKEYVVELQSSGDDHVLCKFELVYDWLVYCHLVASVNIISASLRRHFPGTEDTDDYDI